MKFGIVTIFPEFFETSLHAGVIARAAKKGLIETAVVDLRDYTHDKHRSVDDASFGGGAGMVLKPEPLAAAIRDLRGRLPKARVLALSPGGELLTDALAKRLCEQGELILVCGRYEGIDQRIIDGYCDGELSIGDYVLTGGEPAALVVIDAVARQIPGVVGKAENVEEDSFSAGLKYPVYTRPAVFEGRAVPDALLSGNQARVDEWRREAAMERTANYRPDLLCAAGRSRIALQIEGFDADAAAALAGRFLAESVGAAVFISSLAAERKKFREAAGSKGQSAAGAKEAEKKLLKAVGPFERIDLAACTGAPIASAAEILKTGKAAVIRIAPKQDFDYATEYFALAIAKLLS